MELSAYSGHRTGAWYTTAFSRDIMPFLRVLLLSASTAADAQLVRWHEGDLLLLLKGGSQMRRYVVLGLVLGAGFGLWDLIVTLLNPLAEDDPRALLLF